jgi:hypothetical protein
MVPKNEAPNAPAPVTPEPDSPARESYVPPALEHLGAWNALTLQQSVPIGPGAFLSHPEDITWPV